MESPESLGEGTTFSLVPFLPAWAPQGRWLQGQSKGSRSLCTALPSMSAPRQSQWDVAGETQAEDGAISHSHSETGPQTGWEQCCWLQHGWPGSCPAAEHPGQITSLLSASVPCL